MVDLLKKEITIQGRVFKIVSWETWWAVEGLGLFNTLEAAAKEVPENTFNILTIRPVPVAVSDTPGVYETL